MSTNNQLIILKTKSKVSPFEVHENMCVDNDFKSSKKTILKKFATLIQAISYANKYCGEYPYVEYGYHVDDNCLINKKEE